MIKLTPTLYVVLVLGLVAADVAAFLFLGVNAAAVTSVVGTLLAGLAHRIAPAEKDEPKGPDSQDPPAAAGGTGSTRTASSTTLRIVGGGVGLLAFFAFVGACASYTLADGKTLVDTGATLEDCRKAAVAHNETCKADGGPCAVESKALYTACKADGGL